MEISKIFRRPKDTGGNGNERAIKSLPTAERIHYSFEKTDREWQFNKQYLNTDTRSLDLEEKESKFTNDNTGVVDALEALNLPCKVRKLDGEEWEAIIYIKKQDKNELDTFHGFVAATHGKELKKQKDEGQESLAA